VRPNSCEAFTFVEVLVALVVLSLAVVPLLTLYGSSATGAVQAVDLVAAMHQAAAELEALRSLPWPVLVGRPTGIVHRFDNGEISWSREEVEPGRLLKIAVEVRFTRAGMSVPPQALATLVARRHAP
jgi:hypothetical protein